MLWKSSRLVSHIGNRPIRMGFRRLDKTSTVKRCRRVDLIEIKIYGDVSTAWFKHDSAGLAGRGLK